MKKDNKKYNLFFTQPNMEYTKPNFFILFMAIVLISNIIWNRLFRERLAKYLSVELLVDKKFIWLSLIIFSFLFLYYLRQYFGIKPKENGLIMRLFTYMYEIKFIKKTYYFLTDILDSPKHLYQIIFEHLNEIKPPISVLIIKIRNIYPLRFYEYHKIIYFLFYVFPRMLVAITIFIEIIFLRQIIIFYKLLLLLIIPLLYRVLIFILDHYVKDTIIRCEVFYKYTYDQEKNTLSFERPTINLTDPDLLKYRESQDPYKLTRIWYENQITYDKLYHIQLFHEKYKILINVFICGLYTISFIFYIVILYGYI